MGKRGYCDTMKGGKGKAQRELRSPVEKALAAVGQFTGFGLFRYGSPREVNVRRKLDVTTPSDVGGSSPFPYDEGKLGKMDDRTPLLADEAGGGNTMAHGKAAWDNPHGNVSKGATRAAVLGGLDGLLSNLCLILGVMAPCLTGAQSDKQVLLTGIAGIFAGAFSMAVGEWLSITAENEYLAKEIENEKAHLRTHREEENLELIEYFIDQGLQESTAAQVIRDLESRADASSRMLNFHAKFHWGIDEDDLGGSAAQAAMISFVAFAMGGFIPLIPWVLPCSSVMFLGAATCLKVKLAMTIGLSTIAMFSIGFALAKGTPTNSFYGGFRHTTVGALSALFTFTIGYAFGAALT